MKRTSWRTGCGRWLGAVLLAALAACSGLRVNYRASSALNKNSDGQSSPLNVRLYQLPSRESAAEVRSYGQEPGNVLGTMRQELLTPEREGAWELQRHADARCLAVVPNWNRRGERWMVVLDLDQLGSQLLVFGEDGIEVLDGSQTRSQGN